MRLKASNYIFSL